MSIMTLGMKEGRTVYVSNVADEMNDEHLSGMFTKFGAIEEVMHLEGRGPEAIWSIVFECESDAKHALLLNGALIMGLPVEVKSKTSVAPVAPVAADDPMQNNGALVLTDPNLPPGIDPITLAAMQALQPQAQAQKSALDGIPGAGITPQLIEMIKVHPELAGTLIPLIRANPNSSAADLGLLRMLTDFHRKRALQQAELKEAEEKAALQRQVDELRLKLEAKERDDKKRRRGSSSGSNGESAAKRARKADAAAADAPPPAEAQSGSVTPVPKRGAVGGHDVDASYVSDEPTAHLYVVFPAGTKLPSLSTVQPLFEKCEGSLTDLKVSKSKCCVFASLSVTLTPSDLKSLSNHEVFKDTSFNYARTSYGPYLRGESPKDREKEDKGAVKDRDRRGRDRRDDRDRDRRDEREDRDRERREDRDRRDRDRRDDRDRDRRGDRRDRDRGDRDRRDRRRYSRIYLYFL